MSIDQDADPETVVLVSTAGSTSGRTICHELSVDSDGTVVPRCRNPGRYRTVDPAVYPNGRPCQSDYCWADGIPDEMALSDDD